MVVTLAAGIIIYKRERSHKPAVEATQNISPSKLEVILVADLSEANEKGDHCAEIIHLVRDAGRRGFKVEEFAPDSDSPLIKQYQVLTIPTVLILDPNGKVVSRYEGESGLTVREIRTRLTALDEAQR